MSKKQDRGSREPGCTGVIFMMVVGFTGTAYQALALYKLWAWHLVPLGALPIDYWQVTGVVSTLALFLFRSRYADQAELATWPIEQRYLAMVMVGFIPTTLCLGAGWLAMVLHGGSL